MIYISGPMTGLPELNYPAFFQVAEELNELGYKTINPAEIGLKEGWEWQDYMKEALIMMMAAQVVVLLDGWEKSKGAQIEVRIAKELNMKVYTIGELFKNPYPSDK